MGFRFRLEKVLWWREEIEKRKLITVAALQRQRDLVAYGLRRLEEEKEVLKTSFTGFKGRSSSAWELHLCGLRSRWIWEELEKQKQQLKLWDKKVEVAFKEWEEARRGTEMIRRLKVRAKERFMAKLRREEIRLLDEIALRNYHGEETAGI